MKCGYCGKDFAESQHHYCPEGQRFLLDELARLRAELARADVALSEAPFHGQEELSEASLADGIRNYRNAVEAELSYLRAVNAELVEAMASPELLETLAAIEHERWAGWMRYQAEKAGAKHPITGEFYEARWKRQSETPYSALPEQERESDRIEARKTLAAIRAALSRTEQTKPEPETCVWATSIIDTTEWITSCTRWYRKTFHSTSGACPNCGRAIEVQP